jgi:galactokinase
MGQANKREIIERTFRERYGGEPKIVRSPGRVNLLGEHTDYNEGFVMPAAINRAVYIAIAPRDDKTVSLTAVDVNGRYDFPLEKLERAPRSWANYVIGVVDQMSRQAPVPRGFNAVFGGDIPIGAGLSSSAALEAGFAHALNEIFELGYDKLELVKMAQRAENEFVGVRCGIMDQFINIFGKKGSALKLDCRTLEYDYVPFESDDVTLVLLDTRVKHSLASSEYNTRRAQCEEGVEALRNFDDKIDSLRDVSPEFLRDHEADLDPTVYRRCRYVVEENQRLLAGADDLARGDVEAFGKKMFETHRGLRDDYEVSCAELDALVEIAERSGLSIGSRMMGGGFGGCTINLVKRDASEKFIELVKERYSEKIGKDISVYQVEIESGAAFL